MKPDERKNIEFPINYYGHGGSLPPSGTKRWVRGGQFTPGGFSETAMKNGEHQTEDAVSYSSFGCQINPNLFVYGMGGGHH